MYQDLLLNLQKGHKFLQENFGYTPRVALSVSDVSGHSSTYPRPLADSGIESLYILNVNDEIR